MGQLERFGVSMDGELLDAFDRYLGRKGYENRSEALRDLVRSALVADAWTPASEKPTVGTLTIVYDHHQRELSDKLADLGHDHHGMHMASMHLHLDHDNCLEVTALQGTPSALTAYTDAVLALKGVRHGRFVPTGYVPT